MKILVLNCGSSSIKYQLLEMENANSSRLLAKGLLERIGLEMGEFTHKYNGEKYYEQLPIPNHTEGIKLVLKALVDPKMGVIKDLKEIDAVGHRVAHGGELFPKSVLIDKKVVEGIQSLTDLAPLHNPGSLQGIHAMEEVLPGIPMAAVFDTSFHSTMPPEAYLYAVPYEYYDKYRVRRYGFHGTSHKYVAEKAAAFVGKDWKQSKIVTCHLGSGASIAAVEFGKSVETSMGFTPVEGLVMGSRTGDLDLGAFMYIMDPPRRCTTPSFSTSMAAPSCPATTSRPPGAPRGSSTTLPATIAAPASRRSWAQAATTRAAVSPGTCSSLHAGCR